MIVRSPAFTDNGVIPQKYTGFGEDISPELFISGAPEETVSFAVTLDDLDVPFQNCFSHWVVWNIPAEGIIPEGLSKGAVICEPVNACQGKAWGKNCYRGPKPPVFIKKEHRYLFTVYALDCELGISTESKRKALLEAMKGHILAEAELVGRYGRG